MSPSKKTGKDYTKAGGDTRNPYVGIQVNKKAPPPEMFSPSAGTKTGKPASGGT